MTGPVPADEDFDEFVRARGPALYKSAYLFAAHPQDAEDLLQTVLADMGVRWATVRRSDDVERYVRRALANRAVSARRRPFRRHESSMAELPDAGAHEAFSAAVEMRMLLLAALHALPARQRAVVVLRYYEGLSESETADVLGCSPGTVKSQASKALAKLRAATSLAEFSDDARD